MNSEIAKRLQVNRLNSNLSQEQLAERIGVSRQTVSKWERAESSPDMENLIALAKLYKTTLDEKARDSGHVEDHHNMLQPEMTVEATVSILKLLEQNGIEVYVDGGWGVDALLGEQTRRHEDLDITLPHKYVPQLRELLAACGYEDVPRPDSWECNFVLGDNEGHLVDVHSYTFDENGKNIFGVAYEPHHLTGTGTINGHPVKCPPPDVMVEFHTGYDVDKDDYRDVKALCERFGIALPKDYEKFGKRP